MHLEYEFALKREKKMISNLEISGLSEADLHYELCAANLDGAQRLCTDMINGDFSTSYSHATVVMSLLHHSIELFLKYAISRSGKKPPTHHYIRGLHEEYNAAFPDKIFSLELPFITQFLGYKEDEMDELLKEEQQDRNRTDQMGRYHSDRSGNHWKGIMAFIPTTFLAQTEFLASRFIAIKEEIERIYEQPD